MVQSTTIAAQEAQTRREARRARTSTIDQVLADHQDLSLPTGRLLDIRPAGPGRALLVVECPHCSSRHATGSVIGVPTIGLCHAPGTFGRPFSIVAPAQVVAR